MKKEAELLMQEAIVKIPPPKMPLSKGYTLILKNKKLPRVVRPVETFRALIILAAL